MMNRLKALFKKNSASLASGVFIGTSYIPLPPWALFFAYIPLWLQASRESSLKKVFWMGWIAQFLLTLIGFHWISYTAYVFGNMPWPLALLVLMIFCAFMHIYIPFSLMTVTLLKRYFKLSESKTILLFAISLIFWERCWPSIFPWHLGYAFMTLNWPIYQWADVVGFQGLSALVLLINAGCAIVWLRYRQTPKKLFSAVGAILVVILILTMGGSYHARVWQEFDAKINVLAAQANIGDFEKMQAEQGLRFQDEILNRFLTLTETGLLANPDTDLIIWPETAFPDYLDVEYKDKLRPTQLRAALARWNKPLLTGSFSKDYLELDPNKNTFNGIFLVPPQPQINIKPYHKTHLLAFGEYLPFSERFPILLKWITMVSNFGRGQGPQILEIPSLIGTPSPLDDVKIGPQVCYEGLYPEFTRQLSEKGALILANVTNDSWFGQTFQPQQHMLMTLARAIEVRRPLIRSTNTGITTAILADGTRLQESPVHQVWSGSFAVKYKKNPPQTFYVTHGHYDFWLYLFLFIVILGISKRHERT